MKNNTVTGYLLYAATFVIEVAAAWLRWRVAFWFFGIWASDQTANYIALIIGYTPLIWSLLNVFGVPGGGFATRRALGARVTSERERAALRLALEMLPSNTPAPKWVYVIDTPDANAFVIGKALYISRVLFPSQYLAPIVAHELGHLNTSDGRLILGLNRFVIPFFHRLAVGLAGDMLSDDKQIARQAKRQMGCVRSGFITLFALMGGGLGVRLMTLFWLSYWRSREFHADRYAAERGQGHGLAESLEQIAQPFDMAIPYFSGMTHPYTELRIDKLLNYDPDHPAKIEPPILATVAGVVILVLGMFAFLVVDALHPVPTSASIAQTPTATAQITPTSGTATILAFQSCGTFPLQADVALFAEPRADAPAIRRLQRGWDVVRSCDEPIRADSVTWAKVKRGDTIGWVVVEAVNTPTPQATTTTEPTARITPTATAVPSGTICSVYELAATLDGKPLQSLAIHDTPGLNTRTIGYLKAGQQGRATSTEIKQADGRDWVKLQSPDANGWASLRALACVLR